MLLNGHSTFSRQHKIKFGHRRNQSQMTVTNACVNNVGIPCLRLRGKKWQNINQILVSKYMLLWERVEECNL